MKSSKKAFLSTLPRGERRNVGAMHADNLAVSIHAPARGATRLRARARMCEGFYPRSRAGSDVRLTEDLQWWTEFLSTLPRGERLAERRANAAKVVFLSTLPRGERHFWNC